ncbi:hypothetical protein, partial [Streptomyces sp. E5N91]|uniref:hypothetical protein n=1 Tax=Streptomyces sp. E5N91 TaxID=1851996 RepID=UPI001EE90447
PTNRPLTSQRGRLVVSVGDQVGAVVLRQRVLAEQERKSVQQGAFASIVVPGAMCRFGVSGWVSVTACQAGVFPLVGC